MTQTSEVIKRARRELIQQTLDKICETRDFNELKRIINVILMHLWLHKIAEQEKLFESEKWLHPECRDELIEKIREFLVRHLK